MSGTNYRHGGGYPSSYLFFNVHLFTHVGALANKAEMQILNLFSKPDTANVGRVYFLLFCKWAFLDRDKIFVSVDFITCYLKCVFPQ